MGLGSAAYNLVLVFHILCAIVGFGGVFLNGLYGQQAKTRRGAEGMAIAEANSSVSEVASLFIYAVPVFGALLVWLSDGVWSFSDTWVWMSLTLYVAALGVSHGVLRPTVRRMHVLMRELATVAAGGGPSGPPPQARELQQLGQRAGATGAVLNLTLVAMLLLMVWKPGS